MSYRRKGKYVTIDPDAPQALGICDLTGFVFNRRDLVKQMEWRGNELVWNGFLVGRPFNTRPNPQLSSPPIPPDPVPIIDPRPQQTTPVSWSQGLGLNWINLNVPWGSWGTFDDGIAALPGQQRLQQLQNVNWGQG